MNNNTNRLKHLPILLLLSFLLLGLQCKPGEAKAKKEAKPNNLSYIEGAIVVPSGLPQTLTLPGTLLPSDEAVLMPEISGRIIQVNIPEGQSVKKGVLLVKLSDADLQAQRHKALAQLETARATLKRQTELLKINGISQTEYEASALSVNVLEADLDLLDAQIRKTEVRAPFDGIVGLRNISPGSMVSPGSALTTLRDNHRLRLDFSVPERFAGRIGKGAKVRFAFEGSDKTFSAVVLATEQGIDPATRTLKVRASAEPASGLVPGAYATVTLDLGGSPNALRIPAKAVIPQAREKKVFVCRQGRAVLAKIKTGYRNDTFVEVLSGLAAGDTIVTTGLLFVKPGMALSFAKVTK